MSFIIIWIYEHMNNYLCMNTWTYEQLNICEKIHNHCEIIHIITFCFHCEIIHNLTLYFHCAVFHNCKWVSLSYEYMNIWVIIHMWKISQCYILFSYVKKITLLHFIFIVQFFTTVTDFHYHMNNCSYEQLLICEIFHIFTFHFHCSVFHKCKIFHMWNFSQM